MRTILLSLAALVWLAAPAAAQEQPRLAPGDPIPPAELRAFVDGMVTAAMIQDGIVGASVSVVQNGEVVLAEGYGYADLAARRRVDPDRTLFRIGSVTKTFTWIALWNEIEAGRVGLDDPVNDHLPPELQIPDQGFSQPIRVRDLMVHAPGFEDRVLGVLFARNPEDVRSLSTFLRETRPVRVREPGELSSYSNYGVALAGAIIEHETGRPWQDVIESEILLPLGMRHTSPREPYPAREGLPAPMAEDLAADLSVVYGAGQSPRTFEHITQIAPAGAISASAGDMSAYMLALLGDGSLGGARVFGPETARAFREPMTSLPAGVGNWAGGFSMQPAPGGFTAYGHDGATLTSFTSMIVIPELGLGVFATTNTLGGATLTNLLWRSIVQHFYVAEADPLPGAPDQVAAMSAYAGLYLPSRRQNGGLGGMISRLQLLPVAVTPDGYLSLPFPFPGARYVPTDVPGVFESTIGAGQVMFEERRGRMTILSPSLGFERVGALRQPQWLLLAGGLAALAATAAIAGGFVRIGRDLRATKLRRLAGGLEIGAASLWLAALIATGLFAASLAGDRATIVYDWPTPPILAFSTLALLAAVLSAASAGLLPLVWAGRSATGWSAWRKARFTATALVFAALAGLLLSWGALQPWSP